jgi:hypothetical protein
MEITLKLITLVGIVNNIDAYGSGAPVSVCQDMTPQHGVSAQTGAVPYQITVDPSTYCSWGLRATFQCAHALRRPCLSTLIVSSNLDQNEVYNIM